MSDVKAIFEKTIQTDHKVITEELSKSILKEYGVDIPPFALVTSEAEAVKKAKKIGFPIVMKVVSPQILHKTDVGGVKVGINSAGPRFRLTTRSSPKNCQNPSSKSMELIFRRLRL